MSASRKGMFSAELLSAAIDEDLEGDDIRLSEGIVPSFRVRILSKPTHIYSQDRAVTCLRFDPCTFASQAKHVAAAPNCAVSVGSFPVRIS